MLLIAQKMIFIDTFTYKNSDFPYIFDTFTFIKN